jgi:hypothetical protein
MQKLLLLSICALASTSAAFGQLLKVTTITVASTNVVWTTNRLTIPNGQAARVGAAIPYARVFKDGLPFEVWRGDVIQGPATFEIYGGHLQGETIDALLTLERWTVLKVPIR